MSHTPSSFKEAQSYSFQFITDSAIQSPKNASSPVAQLTEEDLLRIIKPYVQQHFKEFILGNLKINSWLHKDKSKAEVLQQFQIEIEKKINQSEFITKFLTRYKKLFIKHKALEIFPKYKISFETFIKIELNYLFKTWLLSIEREKWVDEDSLFKFALNDETLDLIKSKTFELLTILEQFLIELLPIFSIKLNSGIQKKINSNMIHVKDERRYTSSQNDLYLRRMDSLAKLLSLNTKNSACVAVSVFNQQLMIACNASGAFSSEVIRDYLVSKFKILKFFFEKFVSEKVVIFQKQDNSIEQLDLENQDIFQLDEHQAGYKHISVDKLNQVWTVEFCQWVDELVGQLINDDTGGSTFNPFDLIIAAFRLAKSLSSLPIDADIEVLFSTFFNEQFKILIPEVKGAHLGFYDYDHNSSFAISSEQNYFYVFQGLAAEQKLSIHAEQLLVFSYLSKAKQQNTQELKLNIGLSLLCCETCFSLFEQYPNIHVKGTHSHAYANVLDISDCEIQKLVKDEIIASSSSSSKEMLEASEAAVFDSPICGNKRGNRQLTPMSPLSCSASKASASSDENKRIKTITTAKPSPLETPAKAHATPSPLKGLGHFSMSSPEQARASSSTIVRHNPFGSSAKSSCASRSLRLHLSPAKPACSASSSQVAQNFLSGSHMDSENTNSNTAQSGM